jgi:hypothetical protein
MYNNSFKVVPTVIYMPEPDITFKVIAYESMVIPKTSFYYSIKLKQDKHPLLNCDGPHNSLEVLASSITSHLAGGYFSYSIVSEPLEKEPVTEIGIHGDSNRPDLTNLTRKLNTEEMKRLYQYISKSLEARKNRQ